MLNPACRSNSIGLNIRSSSAGVSDCRSAQYNQRRRPWRRPRFGKFCAQSARPSTTKKKLSIAALSQTLPDRPAGDGIPNFQKHLRTRRQHDTEENKQCMGIGGNSGFLISCGRQSYRPRPALSLKSITNQPGPSKQLVYLTGHKLDRPLQSKSASLCSEVKLEFMLNLWRIFRRKKQAIDRHAMGGKIICKEV